VASPRVVVEGPSKRAWGGADSRPLHELYWECVPYAVQKGRRKARTPKKIFTSPAGH